MLIREQFVPTLCKVMVYATVKKTGSLMKPSFGVFMHNPPIMVEDCDHRELADNPDFRIEATLGGHFVILQVFFFFKFQKLLFLKNDFKGDDDERVVKVANVKKDNYNINIMENFPMDIEIGPNVRKFKIN